MNHCVSLAIHLNQASEIWLFNCSESTQHVLIRSQIKLSLISKIFITSFNLDNISGLLGLLSTLNLDDRNKSLDIYGPTRLQAYLKLNSKYSQTNFSYSIRVHNLKLYNTFFDTFHIVRAIPLAKTNQEFGYIITFRQNLGKFNLSHATVFNIIRGPLYGKLKQHNNFITPDGQEIQGKQFSETSYKGQKIIIMPKIQCNKMLKELYWKANYVIYTN